ncbi:hypothetical protein WA158_002985 [Blastocystis sp. Blastoise]
MDAHFSLQNTCCWNSTGDYIVLGDSSGYIHFLTDHGQLLIKQQIIQNENKNNQHFKDILCFSTGNEETIVLYTDNQTRNLIENIHFNLIHEAIKNNNKELLYEEKSRLIMSNESLSNYYLHNYKVTQNIYSDEDNQICHFTCGKGKDTVLYIHKWIYHKNKFILNKSLSINVSSENDVNSISLSYDSQWIIIIYKNHFIDIYDSDSLQIISSIQNSEILSFLLLPNTFSSSSSLSALYITESSLCFSHIIMGQSIIYKSASLQGMGIITKNNHQIWLYQYIKNTLNIIICTMASTLQKTMNLLENGQYEIAEAYIQENHLNKDIYIKYRIEETLRDWNTQKINNISWLNNTTDITSFIILLNSCSDLSYLFNICVSSITPSSHIQQQLLEYIISRYESSSSSSSSLISLYKLLYKFHTYILLLSFGFPSGSQYWHIFRSRSLSDIQLNMMLSNQINALYILWSRHLYIDHESETEGTMTLTIDGTQSFLTTSLDLSIEDDNSINNISQTLEDASVPRETPKIKIDKQECQEMIQTVISSLDHVKNVMDARALKKWLTEYVIHYISKKDIQLLSTWLYKYCTSLCLQNTLTALTDAYLLSSTLSTLYTQFPRGNSETGIVNPTDNPLFSLYYITPVLQVYINIYTHYHLWVPVMLPLDYPDYNHVICMFLARADSSTIVEDEITQNIIPFSREYNVDLDQVFYTYMSHQLAEKDISENSYLYNIWKHIESDTLKCDVLLNCFDRLKPPHPSILLTMMNTCVHMSQSDRSSMISREYSLMIAENMLLSRGIDISLREETNGLSLLDYILSSGDDQCIKDASLLLPIYKYMTLQDLCVKYIQFKIDNNLSFLFCDLLNILQSSSLPPSSIYMALLEIVDYTYNYLDLLILYDESRWIYFLHITIDIYHYLNQNEYNIDITPYSLFAIPHDRETQLTKLLNIYDHWHVILGVEEVISQSKCNTILHDSLSSKGYQSSSSSSILKTTTLQEVQSLAIDLYLPTSLPSLLYIKRKVKEGSIDGPIILKEQWNIYIQTEVNSRDYSKELTMCCSLVDTILVLICIYDDIHENPLSDLFPSIYIEHKVKLSEKETLKYIFKYISDCRVHLFSYETFIYLSTYFSKNHMESLSLPIYSQYLYCSSIYKVNVDTFNDTYHSIIISLFTKLIRCKEIDIYLCIPCYVYLGVEEGAQEIKKEITLAANDNQRIFMLTSLPLVFSYLSPYIYTYKDFIDLYVYNYWKTQLENKGLPQGESLLIENPDSIVRNLRTIMDYIHYDMPTIVDLCQQYDISTDKPYTIYMETLLTCPSAFPNMHIPMVIDGLIFKIPTQVYIDCLLHTYRHIPISNRTLLQYILRILMKQTPIPDGVERDWRVLEFLLNNEYLLTTINTQKMNQVLDTVEEHSLESSYDINTKSIKRSSDMILSQNTISEGSKRMKQNDSINQSIHIKADSNKLNSTSLSSSLNNSNNILSVSTLSVYNDKNPEPFTLHTLSVEGWNLLKDTINVSNHKDYVSLLDLIGVPKEKLFIHVIQGLIKSADHPSFTSIFLPLLRNVPLSSLISLCLSISTMYTHESICTHIPCYLCQQRILCIRYGYEQGKKYIEDSLKSGDDEQIEISSMYYQQCRCELLKQIYIYNMNRLEIPNDDYQQILEVKDYEESICQLIDRYTYQAGITLFNEYPPLSDLETSRDLYKRSNKIDIYDNDGKGIIYLHSFLLSLCQLFSINYDSIYKRMLNKFLHEEFIEDENFFSSESINNTILIKTYEERRNDFNEQNIMKLYYLIEGCKYEVNEYIDHISELLKIATDDNIEIYSYSTKARLLQVLLYILPPKLFIESYDMNSDHLQTILYTWKCMYGINQYKIPLDSNNILSINQPRYIYSLLSQRGKEKGILSFCLFVILQKHINNSDIWLLLLEKTYFLKYYRLLYLILSSFPFISSLSAKQQQSFLSIFKDCLTIFINQLECCIKNNNDTENSCSYYLSSATVLSISKESQLNAITKTIVKIIEHSPFLSDLPLEHYCTQLLTYSYSSTNKLFIQLCMFIPSIEKRCELLLKSIPLKEYSILFESICPNGKLVSYYRNVFECAVHTLYDHKEYNQLYTMWGYQDILNELIEKYSIDDYLCYLIEHYQFLEANHAVQTYYDIAIIRQTSNEVIPNKQQLEQNINFVSIKIQEDPNYLIKKYIIDHHLNQTLLNYCH